MSESDLDLLKTYIGTDQCVGRLQLRRLGFADLESKVVLQNRCSGCAACVISCPYKEVMDYGDEKPILIGECRFCEICVKVCPRYDLDPASMEERFFGRRREVTEEFGVSRRIAVARSLSPSILKLAQDGGVATALLKTALEDGLIDAAIVSGVESSRPWVPKPKVVSTTEELAACAGTRYSYSPNLLALPSALAGSFERIAIVGTPCIISGVRKMQLSGLKKLTRSITFMIGLMCSECFSFDCLMKEKIEADLNVHLGSVVKVNIKGKILVKLLDGSTRQMPLKEAKLCSRKSCAACDDFSSEYADVSLGGVGLSGFTLVVTRSKQGEDLFLNSLPSLDAKDAREYAASLELVSKLSRRKRARAAKFSTPRKVT